MSLSITFPTIFVQGPNRFETFLENHGFCVEFSRLFSGGGQKKKSTILPILCSSDDFFFFLALFDGIRPSEGNGMLEKKKNTFLRNIWPFILGGVGNV